MRQFLIIVVCAALPAAAQPLDGFWRSQGYGLVYQFQGGTLKAFEVTSRTCLPGFTAKSDLGGATFRTADNDVFVIRPGGDHNHRLLHEDGSASDIRIDRVPRLPSPCDRPTADTPLDNFDVFAQTWAENYISFDLKHADWNQIVAAARKRVTAQTSPAGLFDILQSMIQPFGDAHTFLEAPQLKRRFHGYRAGTDRVIKDMVGETNSDEFRTTGVPKLLAVTDRAYLHGPLRKFCNNQLQFGKTDDETGYLRILSFNGYARGGFAPGAAALETTLDEIFRDTSLKALVIDVCINFGGADPYGLQIASRLATGEYLAYTKYARASPGSADPWTPGDPSMVRPSPRPGFRGPVVELTGPLTISAGETFTQALMGRTPRVTRLGENTQGVFSDVLVRRLPNGWIFGLPNEVYRTPDGKAFDGPGIPPDIAIPVFAPADIAAGADPALARAVAILRVR